MYQPFVTLLNQKLAKYELYVSQYAVLRELYREGDLTIGEISKRRSVERPTITRTVQRLHSLGYVEGKSGNDKRERKISLTDLGKKTCAEIQHSIEEFELKALEGISKADQMKAAEILAKVHLNLISIGGEKV